MKDVTPFVSFGWREGRLIDFWSFVHFLSGILLAIILMTHLHLSFLWSIISTFFLLILWEMFELIMGIGEHLSNRVSDVAVGCIGFLCTFYFLPMTDNRLLILIVLVMFLLDILGMRAYIARATP